MKKNTKSNIKVSDYIRLGRISIKARKKSTRNTVFGMAFGLILLVPMIFFALSFYIDMANKVNSIKTASCLSIPLKNINDSSPATAYKAYTQESIGAEGLPAFASYNDLIGLEEVEEYILSEYSNFNEYTLQLKVGSKIYDLDTPPESYYFHGMNQLKIIYTEESTCDMFTAAELADYKKMTGSALPFLDMCDSGFSKQTKGKNEIILSEVLLKKWGIKNEEVANKNISILFPAAKVEQGQFFHYTIDNDNISTNAYKTPGEDWDMDKTYNEGDLVNLYGTSYIARRTTTETPEHSDDWEVLQYQFYLCYDYKVVGILKEDFFTLPNKQEEAHFWVSAASVYYQEGEQNYKPIGYTITQRETESPLLTFEESIENVIHRNKNQQYMMLIQLYADRYNEIWDMKNITYELNRMIIQLQMQDFAKMHDVVTQTKDMLKLAYGSMDATSFESLITNQIYVQFSLINRLGSIIIIVFAITGGIIFFTNMLNLLNTVRYSVESRKNYIGVMRAIGAKSSSIPKLYIFEMLIIFFKTFIWVAIFSSLIAYGIKYLLDKIFVFIEYIVRFEVNFWYFPITLGGAFFITTLIGILFAITSCRITAYQPILKTMLNEL